MPSCPSLRCRALGLLLSLFLPALLSACSIFSPLPAWELLKVAGSAANSSVARGTLKASNTIHHNDALPTSLCIEYNRDAQAPDLVPALQAELRQQRIESRVYEAGSNPLACTVWLRYGASVQWDIPPYGSGYKSYVSAVNLSLHRSNGSLMSSSSFELDDSFISSRWVSTRSKLAPVVKALITGFDS